MKTDHINPNSRAEALAHPEQAPRLDSLHTPTANLRRMTGRVTCGDRLELLRGLPSESVDFVITRLPESLGPNGPAILKEVVRVMKHGAYCVNYASVERCIDTSHLWLNAGFAELATVGWMALSKPVGVNVWAKGRPARPLPLPTLPEGAELPSTRIERMIAFITPIMERYSGRWHLVLDPFADEAVVTTLRSLNRLYIALEEPRVVAADSHNPTSQTNYSHE